jgi:hypothetical protein
MAPFDIASVTVNRYGFLFTYFWHFFVPLRVLRAFVVRIAN